MEEAQQFCLRWNNYQSSITSAFENLRDDEDFVDVTLASEGRSLKAHRVVLSACSPYFKELLKSTPCKHPVVVLQDVPFVDLQSLVQFMYHGEVNIDQISLASFLRTAEVLHVSGLTQHGERMREELRSPSPPPVSRHLNSSSVSESIFTPAATLSNHKVTNHRNDHTIQSPPATFTNNACNNNDRIDSRRNSEHSESDEGATPKRTRLSESARSSPVSADEDELESPTDNRHFENDSDLHDGLPDDILPPIMASYGNDKHNHSLNNHSPGHPHGHSPHPGGLNFGPPPPLLELSGLNPFSQLTGFAMRPDIKREPGLVVPGGNNLTSKYLCPLCGKVLSSRPSLKRHITDKHMATKEEFRCPICDRVYSSRNSLLTHTYTYHKSRETGGATTTTHHKMHHLSPAAGH